MVVGALVAQTALSWRLAQGPISLSFLSARITAAVEAALPGDLGVQIADTVLERDGDTGAIHLGLIEIAALDPQGEAIFRAPRASVRLSRSALLTGRVVPKQVELIEPAVTVLASEGPLRLRGGTAELMPAAAPAEALGAVLGLFADASGLARIGIRDATISVVGGDLPPDVLERVSLRAVRFGDGLQFDASIGGGAGAPQLSGTLRHDPSSGLVIDIAARNVAVSDFGPLAPAGLAEMFSSPVSADIIARIDRRGALDAVSGTVFVGAGHVGGGRLNLLVDEADVAFSWSRGSGRIVIQPSKLLAGYNRATIAGEIVLPERGEFNYGTVPIRLMLTDVSFGDPSGGPRALYPSITLEAFYVAQQGLMHVSRLDVAAPQGAMSFVGIIGGSGVESPGIRLAGTMLPMPYEALAELWPPFLGHKTRKWVLDHLRAGTITDARLTVDIPPGVIAAALRGVPLPKTAYLLEFGLEDVEFRYLGDMPPISGAKGRAELTPDSFDLRMEPGSVVRLASGEIVDVGAGHFRVGDRRAVPPTGRISLDLAGSVPAMLRLFDHKPLEIAKGRGFDPSTFSGDAEMAINLAVPLLPAVHISDVDLNIDGRIENFAAKNFQGARNVSDGRLMLSVVDGRILIAGEGLLDGVPAEIAVNEALDGSGGGGAHSVTMTLDESARQSLGIGLGDMITGPVIITVSEVLATASGTTQRIEADLTPARVDFPHLGIEKPTGESARASFLLAQDGETVRLTELSFESSTVRIEGEATFSRDGELMRLELPTVRTARGTDVAVSGRSEGEEHVFSVRGESIDLRPGLRSLTAIGTAGGPAAAQAGTGRRERIEIAVDSVLGHNGQRLSEVTAAISRSGPEISGLELTGRTASGAGVLLRYSDDGGSARLAADTQDGGRLLAWTGIYANLRGGRLQLSASRPAAEQPLDGLLVINGFAIADDPSLAHLIARGEHETRQQIDPARQVGERQRVNPSNVGFDTLSVPFVQSESGIRIRDGVLRGPAVGATLEGAVDLASGRMALNGTYVPLYEINNLFGQLPLFGPLLGGRRNEGLIGITYSVTGPIDGPVLTVNPLSFVTPGVFRYILGMNNPRAPRTHTGSVGRAADRP